MKDTIKKSIFFGLGLIAVTKDTVENFVKGLVKEGELTVNEGKDLVSEILDQSNKAQHEVKKIVDVQVKNVINNMPFATKAELKELEKRLRRKK